MIMSVRGAVSFTNARKAGADVSVGLPMPSPPSRTGRASSYVPDWSMKDGLLRLVREIRELHVPKELVGLYVRHCP